MLLPRNGGGGLQGQIKRGSLHGGERRKNARAMVAKISRAGQSNPAPCSARAQHQPRCFAPAPTKRASRRRRRRSALAGGGFGCAAAQLQNPRPRRRRDRHHRPRGRDLGFHRSAPAQKRSLWRRGRQHQRRETKALALRRAVVFAALWQPATRLPF